MHDTIVRMLTGVISIGDLFDLAHFLCAFRQVVTRIIGVIAVVVRIDSVGL
jgi:hypothetical protein